MTEQEKQLLILDLCGRLLYHLLGIDAFGKLREMKVIYPTGTIIAQEVNGESCAACGFKPYLRPMSSMTEEEKNEYDMFFNEDGLLNTIVDVYVDWLNAHHFDYRGLIKKGLAIEVTKENNPYE